MNITMEKSSLNAAGTKSCSNYINEGNENSLSRRHSVCRSEVSCLSVCRSPTLHVEGSSKFCGRVIIEIC